ncbi:MAG: hypothetical protein QGH62_03645 [Nitrospinaceae bacterium]|nr:hypothetical protein [Nitrospinaceae bacterium]
MQGTKNLITILFTIALSIMGLLRPESATAEYKYQLYQNHENFGILIFPAEEIFSELDEYLRDIGFNSVESGHAVMRFGPNNENQTYMMPEPVQRRHSMDRFIILQVIAHKNILVGVFDPEWGLTLPSLIYQLDGLKENIPRTLSIFRKQLKKRETRKPEPQDSKWTRLFATNAVTIYQNPNFMSNQH